MELIWEGGEAEDRVWKARRSVL